jgi:hypothetical protein
LKEAGGLACLLSDLVHVPHQDAVLREALAAPLVWPLPLEYA